MKNVSSNLVTIFGITMRNAFKTNMPSISIGVIVLINIEFNNTLREKPTNLCMVVQMAAWKEYKESPITIM